MLVSLLFLIGIIILVLLSLIGIISAVGLIFSETVVYNKKHGMKYTLTDSSITAEWDFKSPLTQLKLLKLFIQGEFMSETRNKYIREYSRLKKSLEDAGYDMSDFPDYQIK